MLLNEKEPFLSLLEKDSLCLLFEYVLNEDLQKESNVQCHKTFEKIQNRFSKSTQSNSKPLINSFESSISFLKYIFKDWIFNDIIVNYLSTLIDFRSFSEETYCLLKSNEPKNMFLYSIVRDKDTQEIPGVNSDISSFNCLEQNTNTSINFVQYYFVNSDNLKLQFQGSKQKALFSFIITLFELEKCFDSSVSLKYLSRILKIIYILIRELDFLVYPFYHQVHIIKKLAFQLRI